MPICGARKKKCSNCGRRFKASEHDLWECPVCGTNRTCRARVKEEGKRCRIHGGASLSGPAHGRFTHGKYCKVLPSLLSDRYEKALSDRNLLALRDDIALLDARILDLVSGCETGSSKDLWKELKSAFSNLESAIGNGDLDEVSCSLSEMRDVISCGDNDSKIWSEIYHLLDQRRRLVESERKRLVEMHQIITVEQAMVMMARIQEAIVNNVKDRHALTAISTELKQLVDLKPN